MLQTLVGFFVDKKAIGNYNYPVISSCRQPLISHFSLRFQILGSEFEIFYSNVKNWLRWVASQAHIVSLPSDQV